MENQHRKIAGYRELSADEIALMNEVKQQGEQLAALIEKLSKTDVTMIDKRWLAIGTTDLQKGIMALVRCIAQPTTF